MPTVMLLLLLEFRVQASEQGTAHAKLLNTLSVFGHERVSLFGSGVSGLDGRWWFVFVVYHKALLNWPWSCAVSRRMIRFLVVEAEAYCLLLFETRKHSTEQLRYKQPSIRHEYP